MHGFIYYFLTLFHFSTLLCIQAAECGILSLFKKKLILKCQDFKSLDLRSPYHFQKKEEKRKKKKKKQIFK